MNYGFIKKENFTIASYKNIFDNPWTYKIKDLNGEKIIGSFYEKDILLGKL